MPRRPAGWRASGATAPQAHASRTDHVHEAYLRPSGTRVIFHDRRPEGPRRLRAVRLGVGPADALPRRSGGPGEPAPQRDRCGARGAVALERSRDCACSAARACSTSSWDTGRAPRHHGIQADGRRTPRRSDRRLPRSEVSPRSHRSPERPGRRRRYRSPRRGRWTGGAASPRLSASKRSLSRWNRRSAMAVVRRRAQEGS